MLHVSFVFSRRDRENYPQEKIVILEKEERDESYRKERYHCIRHARHNGTEEVLQFFGIEQPFHLRPYRIGNGDGGDVQREILREEILQFVQRLLERGENGGEVHRCQCGKLVENERDEDGEHGDAHPPHSRSSTTSAASQSGTERPRTRTRFINFANGVPMMANTADTMI